MIHPISMFIWCYALLHPIYPCYTILSSVTPCFEAEVAMLCSVTPHIPMLHHVMLAMQQKHSVTLCYAMFHPVLQQKYTVTPMMCGVMQCYTWYNTVVGIIHPVQLCLEREIQTQLLAEGRFAWPCTLPPGGVNSKKYPWCDYPRTIPERIHPLVGLGEARRAWGHMDKFSISIR